MKFEHSGAPSIVLNPEILNRAITEFLRTGELVSMKTGLVMHHVCNYCTQNRIGYVLEFAPGVGFHLRKT